MAEAAGLTQLHPGVFSTITADQTSYDTATGVVTMFVADVFDKGPDGEIQFVSTPSEFTFKYGEPNYAKYGQAAYNVMNFLEAGGQAYIMRVLPDDASYAHSILNVQTKSTTDGKNILLDDLTSVAKVNDVHIRPTVSLVRRNNLTIDMLENELTQDRSGEATVDGYDNNFLMLVTPNGRGESYNNLGYRLTPNDSFATITTSRVYNFEVVQFNPDSNTASLVEGPYFVSFDPDALSANQESMYIEEVINRQSELLNVKVNLTAVNQVAKIINPEVKATTVDIITGGKYDTDPVLVYNDQTQREEDIHLTLHKYTSAGVPVYHNGVVAVNSPEPTDPVQGSLISLDNGVRESSYNLASTKLDYMKELFPKLSSTGFVEFNEYISAIFSKPSGGGAQSGSLPTVITNQFKAKSGSSLFDKYTAAKEAYTATPSEENLNALNGYISDLSDLFRSDVVTQSNKVFAAYSLVENNSPNAGIAAKYQTDISHATDLLARKDQIGIFSTEHRDLIYDIQRSIFQHQLGNVSGDVLDGLTAILDDIDNELSFVYDDLVGVAYLDKSIPTDIANKFDPTKTESLVYKYNTAVQLLADMKAGIQFNDAPTRDKIYSTANTIANSLLELINEVSVKANIAYIEEVVTTSTTSILADVDTFSTAIKQMITTNGTYTEEAIRDTARENIQIGMSVVDNMSSKFFNTNLIDFGNSIKLLLGSDGSFKYEALSNNKERYAAIRRELIKAYSGATNIDVLNTDKIRFSTVLDARYDNDVKKAIVDLARNSRRDFIFFANDAGPEYTVSPADALKWRSEEFNISSEFVAIHAQDLTYFDEYTGRDIRFTPTYALASKLPTLATQQGLHYPLAGTRRGIVDGFKAISWTPDQAHREKLYKAKVNYIQQDSRATRFNSQLTTMNGSGPLAYINNIFTILEIKRGAEDILANYQFEFNDDETTSVLYTVLNNYLSRFTANRSTESVSSEVTSSEYDRSQRIIRVRISVKFTGVIERIILDLNVSK